MRTVKLELMGALSSDWYEEMWCKVAAARSCGHNGTPITENGQLPSIFPSDPYDMVAKPKKTTARSAASMSAAMNFDEDVRCSVFVNISNQFPTA